MTAKKDRIHSLIASVKPNSLVAEQFRSIRTNIQFLMVNKQIQTILFSSSRAFEGKSTVCANLGALFADQGMRVLIVDGDMRVPSMAKMFQLDNHVGLSTLLLSNSFQLDNVVKHISELNIDVLTSGIVPPNPSELLASERMDRLINEMEEKYDLILFDSPPIVSVTDAQIIATKVDGVIMVVRKDIAHTEDVYKARELLNLVEANVLGAVFNGEQNSSHYSESYYR